MPTFEEVTSAVKSEREYQDKRWPKLQHGHELAAYVLFMEDYMSELRYLLSRHDTEAIKEQALNVMRKVVALGFAALEDHGVNERG